MSWRDRLLPASFRGVGFWVDQAKTPVGQKGQLHEYPQRDQPFYEGLGQQAKVHDLTAFIVGENCLEQRDQLLQALEQGAGELVHPWLGRMQVKVGECEMTHTRQDGGLVTFALKFHPDQPLLFPTAVVNSREQLLVAADSLLGSAVRRFEEVISLIKAARIAVKELRDCLKDVYAVIEHEFKELIDTYKDLRQLVLALKELPREVSAEFKGLLKDIRELKDFAREGYRGVLANASQQVEAAKKIDTPKLTTGKDTVAAAQAMANLVQDMLLVKLGYQVAQMPAAAPVVKLNSTPSVAQQAVQPVRRLDVPVAEDVLSLRDALNEVIWQAALKADALHYQALNSLRQQLFGHLTAVSSTGVRLLTLSPKQSLPALVVAYQRFGDATRVGEVSQRNKAVHPGFLPPADLKIAEV
ncbi:MULTISPECIES: DNA circularization protein [Pseudomonas]|uniref:DNA circularization N-terminal domain-containing protein n=1 Tax=Pseudomonas piscis TaxID=2614538 RepID=U6ZRF7_9PSED|nr:MULTISPECIES: DNA circularization N-terminal domain-containing protein [Pseudomonas]ERO61998.1 2-hydroxyacid dehydrogenase [Pseudomonas piscis]MQA52601.1 hydroxyacid dehydrogenase [Pseudomonas piscis]POA58721.1 hydroxyacid dehydrogenase [Pseudomonas sp. FW507-12TSA]WMN18999.1 DNA circularization N-terminal domain-containing protein [Pseudomonas piscis]